MNANWTLRFAVGFLAPLCAVLLLLHARDQRQIKADAATLREATVVIVEQRAAMQRCNVVNQGIPGGSEAMPHLDIETQRKLLQTVVKSAK